MQFSLQSYDQQVANHLRNELQRGRWKTTMPGSLALQAELGANHNTINLALKQLEKEGWLIPQGTGKPRKINSSQSMARPPSMRVQILLYEKSDRKHPVLLGLLHLLQLAGHRAEFSKKTLIDLKMDARRVARFVESNEVDAWVVGSGSRDVLEWFSHHHTPAIALAGRSVEVPLACSAFGYGDAMAEALDRLVALGHQRIILLVREERRKPTPGYKERFFLERLEHHGITTSNYNLPDWEESPNGLQSMLDSLFKLTPPTAMIIDENIIFGAVRIYLANHGILTPDHISLISTEHDPVFDWCKPKVAHMTWDSKPLIRRVLQWVNNISRGKEDRRKTFTKARLVIGGTIGPVHEGGVKWT